MVRPTWDLLTRLQASAEDARHVHNLLCPLDPEDGTPCACGIPALLKELAAVLRADQAYALLEAGELGTLAA